MDDEVFRERFVRGENGLSRISFYLSGMHCAACVWIVEKLPEIVSGVESASVNFALSRVEVLFDPEKVKISKIASVLDSIGYSPAPYSDASADEAATKSERTLLLRMGVAAVCASNIMILSVALYQGHFTGIEERFAGLQRWVSFLLAIPVVLYSAVPFYRAALGGLRAGRLHIDLPISIGIAAGFAASLFNTLRGGSEVYFDSVASLVFLLLVGRWFQQRGVRRAVAQSRRASSILPTRAWVKRGEEVCEVYASSLQTQDLVVVPTGERVPADGTLVQSPALLDLSILSGESRPVSIPVGGKVFAGTKNVGATIYAAVEHVEGESRIGKILKLVEDGAGNRAAVTALTDRIGGYFVAAVLVLAAFTFTFWLRVGFTEALNNTLALLVITCPCALGLSAPIALSVSLSRAAKKGILISGADVVERLAGADAVYLDKTGTVTSGGAKVVKSWFFPIKTLISEGDLARGILALELTVEHPIPVALRERFGGYGAELEPQNVFSRIEHIPGRGVRGHTGNGELWEICSWRTAVASIAPNEIQTQASESCLAEHLTPVALSINGELAAVFGVGDQLREGVRDLVAALQGSGREVFLLSGDANPIVSYAAEQIGIKAENSFGECSPEEKVNVITQSPHRKAAMVGDGVNDAAALSAAYVGIGVRGGAETCLKVSDVFVAVDRFRRLEETFFGADRTMKIIKANLTLSLIYNLLGGGAAMLGYVNPLFAAVLMPISSLTVVLSSTLGRSY